MTSLKQEAGKRLVWDGLPATPTVFREVMEKKTGMREYFLVVYPDLATCGKIQAERAHFYRDFTGDGESDTRPYIMVAHFLAPDMMEATLIRWMTRICTGLRSFEVTFNNYSGLPGQNIYLRVQDPGPFRQLAGQLQKMNDLIDSAGCPPARLSVHPYLELAGRLPPSLFDRAMPVYSRKTFHESFPVAELVLLSRAHPLDTCKVTQVFHLLPRQSHHVHDAA